MEPGASAGGWTFFRIAGLIVGLIGMAGFGVCSLCGVVILGQDPDLIGTMLMFVLPGLLLSFLFFLLVRSMIRRARGRPPG
jgi:hypothetical protein